MAEDKARSSGTAEDVLERVKSHDFLVKCLRKAKFSADLLQDTVDACEINDLNALVLGSGLLSVSEASEQLFLMTDEASAVVQVCRKECLRAGVNFGDGAKLTAEELAEVDEEPEPVPAAPAHTGAHQPGRAHSHTRISPGKTQSPAALLAQAGAASQPAAAAAPAPAAPAPAAAAAPAPSAPPAAPAASTPAPAAASAPAASPAAEPAPAPSPAPQQATPPPAASSSSATHADHPDPNFLIKPPVAASVAAAASTPVAATPHSARHSHIPRPAAATPVTPAAGHATPRERPAAKPATRASPSTTIPTPMAAAAAPTPSMNGKHTPAAGPAASSASSSKPPRPGSAPLTARGPAVTPSSAAAKERPASAMPTQTPPARLPSYARATASHKARLLKEDTDVPSTSSPPPPVTFASTAKPLRRNFYSMPRPSSATPEEKKEPKKPIFDNIRSSLLRPTAAFLAWTAGKSKASKEADLKASQTLQAESSKATKGSSPAMTKSMPGAASSPGAAGAKAGTPEPFRLASMERHQKAQEELARKREEKARQESSIPKFKATPAPSVATGGPASASKTSPKRSSAAQTDVSSTLAAPQP